MHKNKIKKDYQEHRLLAARNMTPLDTLPDWPAAEPEPASSAVCLAAGLAKVNLGDAHAPC